MRLVAGPAQTYWGSLQRPQRPLSWIKVERDQGIGGDRRREGAVWGWVWGVEWLPMGSLMDGCVEVDVVLRQNGWVDLDAVGDGGWGGAWYWRVKF